MQQLMRAYWIVFRKSSFYLLMMTAVMLQACVKTQETDLQMQEKADQEALHKHIEDLPDSVKKKTHPAPSGRYYYEKIDSNGIAQVLVKSNDILAVHYKVSTLNGVVIEDKLDAVKYQPTKLRALTQTGSLIPIGLDAGLGLMQKGEKFRFYLPSTLAFGDYSSDSLNVPAHSNLIIEIRVDSILTDAQQKAVEDNDIKKSLANDSINKAQPLASGIYYQKTQDGTGITPPLSGNTVKLNYTGTYLLDSTIFDRSTAPFSFAIGANKVIPGFEEGIKQMHKGEKGRIIVPSSLAYGATLQVIPERIRPDLVNRNFIDNPADRLRPFSVLVFEIELLDIQ